jgi:ribose transport system substrate-binding protein
MAALVACGSSGGDGASGTATGTSSTPQATGAEYAAELKRLYAGDYHPVPTTGPAAQQGKKVWWISCGQAFEACALETKAFQEAAKALSWGVTVVDGKTDPQATSNLVKQALAAKADGVFTAGMDCPSIKAALLTAKKAKVPVFNLNGYDCDTPEFGAGQPLFAASVNSRGGSMQFGLEYGKARAIAVSAYMKGKGTLLDLRETSILALRTYAKGFDDQIKISCPKCKVVPVDWQFSQLPTAATQIFKSAIQAHPDATAISNPVDAIMSLGLMSAVQQSGRRDLLVYGSDGNPSNIALIREGKQAASLSVSGYGWQTWGVADTANRYFSGSREFPDEGGGWILVDKDHLPAGNASEPPIDYRAAFRKLWDGSGS